MPSETSSAASRSLSPSGAVAKNSWLDNDIDLAECKSLQVYLKRGAGPALSSRPQTPCWAKDPANGLTLPACCFTTCRMQLCPIEKRAPSALAWRPLLFLPCVHGQCRPPAYRPIC